jgi:predicted acetyltransferase
MPVIIRKPNPDEKDQVRRMWAECFPDGGPRFVDWYFSAVYDAGRTLGMFEGSELLSNLQMIPYTLTLRGRETVLDTLTGVATGAAHRNRGYAKTLMAEALRDMAARGRGFTFLYPFNHQFYQRLGWETCSVALDCRKPADELPAVMPGGWEVRAAGPDIVALSGIYERFAAGYNCRSVRDTAAWSKRLDENAANDGFLLLACYGGEPAGYALCEELETEINVGELACTRAEATAALLSALRHRGKAVCWTAPADSRAYLLPGCWMDRVKLQPYVMFRTVDVPLAFRQAAPACDGAFVVGVQGDALRPENNGAFRMDARGGSANAERTDAAPQFCCGVGALARILTGFMDAGEAVEAGLAEGEWETVELLSRMYPRQNNFLFELY